MTPQPERQRDVARLDYRPYGAPLDIEIFPFAALRQRGSGPRIGATHRYAFHMLVCVTEGAVRQVIDFEPAECAAGSLLVLRPGQVHSFGAADGWEGWLVLFRAEFLPSASETVSELLPVLGLDRLPDQMHLPLDDLEATTETLRRMYRDASGDTPPKALHALLRYELCALLLRLTVLHDRRQGTKAEERRGLQRFAAFRGLLEEQHANWHQVARYADALGCTEKSLTRAAQEATGRSAKAVIAQRIVLEAKRLLAHTDRPVYLIADGLGFQEATNFAKFFRREAGVTPVEFRRRHAA
jgi:AraC-like DNA-binding protein